MNTKTMTMIALIVLMVGLVLQPLTISTGATNSMVPVISSSLVPPTYTFGDPITFTASAIDAESGDLGASLIWTSSLQGQIGTGKTFVKNNLQIGTHVITASCTDPGGLTGTATVTVIIIPVNTKPTVTITSPPGSVSVKPTDDHGLRVTWVDNSADETGFEIRRRKKQGETFTTPVIAGMVAQNVHKFIDRPDPGKYQYRVRAFKEDGVSVWSTWTTTVQLKADV